MNFGLFPFDEFYCDFAVMPTLYGNLKAEWDSSTDEPVIINSEFNVLASHSVSSFKLDTKGLPKGQGDKGTVNICRLYFRRHIFHYVMQAFIPNTLTVFVAWMSFSIDPVSIPARVTLNISALIAMVLQYGNITKAIPKVGYLKGIDMWMLGCVLFIFASLCEFTYLARLMRSTSISTTVGDGKGLKIRLDKIDKWTRIVYPIVFLVFMLVYFIVSKLI